jgi:hypothetical protein
MRKLRRRGLGPVTITAGLFIAAGVGAAGVMFSDRLNDIWHGKDWSEPTTAWMALFNDKAPPKAGRAAKVENAVLITPPPLPRLPEPPAAPAPEQPRPLTDVRPAAEPAMPARAAAPNPGTTASLGAAAVRDLPWLPEAEKRAEALEPVPAPPPSRAVASPELSPSSPSARVAVTPPEVAPVVPPSPPPAASAPAAAEVAELIKRARDRIELGDIAGARLLLERAAAGNEPSALMALAETYDPAMLTRWGARGLKADPTKARGLYLRASERGIAEAKARMLALR